MYEYNLLSPERITRMCMVSGLTIILYKKVVSSSKDILFSIIIALLLQLNYHGQNMNSKNTTDWEPFV